jgi:hypothetical protein
MTGSGPSRVLTATLVLLWSGFACISHFMRPPDYGAEANGDQEALRWWGEDGRYCSDCFRESVRRSEELPAYLAGRAADCDRGVPSACRDRAIALEGGCGGLKTDARAARVLAMRACDLGDLRACVWTADSSEFNRSERERAGHKAVGLAEEQCARGTADACAHLHRWRRDRRFGLTGD